MKLVSDMPDRELRSSYLDHKQGCHLMPSLKDQQKVKWKNMNHLPSIHAKVITRPPKKWLWSNQHNHNVLISKHIRGCFFKAYLIWQYSVQMCRLLVHFSVVCWCLEPSKHHNQKTICNLYFHWSLFNWFHHLKRRLTH